MSFDFKKEYKELYTPKTHPEIIEIPPINYIAVSGHGNPNEENGEYKQAISILYAIAYTLKMSYKSNYEIDGFFDFVVPPLEGFWQQEGTSGKIDISQKDKFNWLSVIRLPDFVSSSDFEWAKAEAQRKKRLDCTPAKFTTITEGLCVQIMHFGAYDSEQESIDKMHQYLEINNYQNDISTSRLHHEIYLSDPRRTAPDKWKTVIRHPIKKK